MWWKWIIQGILAISRNPKVQAWAKRKALEAIIKIRNRSDEQTAEIASVAGLYPPTPPLET